MNAGASPAALSGVLPQPVVVSGSRRLLFITYDFPPARTVGAQSCWQIARYLPQHGWTPIILTAQQRGLEAVASPPKGLTDMLVFRARSLPHPLGSYRFLKSMIPARPHLDPIGNSHAESVSPSLGTLRRLILSLLLLPDPYLGWLAPAVLRGFTIIHRSRIDLLLSSGPCWTNHLVGLLLARVTGLPWTAHFRDPWIQRTTWKPTSVCSVRIESVLEKAVVTRATAVVCVTERHTAALRQQYPLVPAGRFVTIPNGYDEADFPPTGTTAIVRNRVFTITYAGELYQRRNPQPIFRAMRRLLDLGIIAPGTARFDLIGECGTADGQPVQEMVVQYRLTDYVTLTGPLDKTPTLSHVLASDLLLLLAEGLTLQIPSKVYEYLRSGRAILALTSEGALADLLRVTGGAWVIDPTDDAGIVDAVASAYGAWKRGVTSLTADPHVVATFDRRALSGRFAALFDAASSASQR